MNRIEAIFYLKKIAEAFREQKLDTEADALYLAIYTLGIVDELKKERDAAVAELRKINGDN